MKLIFAFFMSGFIAFTATGQETFFPTQEGKVLVYKNFDRKGKETATVKYTVTKINSNGEDMDITYICESMDQKMELLFREEITIHKKGDVLYLDMGNFINKAAFQQNGELPAEIQISGNNMELPSNPHPGDQLPDAYVEMALKMGFVNLKSSAQITNRKVEAVENLTAKAGTFETYKLSSEINSSALGIKVKSNTVEWYSKGIGLIKNESYDNKGKLQSSMELVEII